MLFPFLALCSPNPSHAQSTSIPFPQALEESAIEVPSLEDPLDDALIIGNGDINALIYTDGGAIIMNLTKNDVWDARLDTSHDPPLPTLARIKELGATGGTIGDVILPAGMDWHGADSYARNPYPCPILCGRVVIGDRNQARSWRRARAEGDTNTWEPQGTGAILRVNGNAGASAGFSYPCDEISTDDYPQLLLKATGGTNAQYFVELSDNGGVCFISGWADSVPESEERLMGLPPNKKVSQITLYGKTRDGSLAENHFESLVFLGNQKQVAIDLAAKSKSSTARLDLRRAVARIDGAPGGPPQAEIRALAGANSFYIVTEAEVKIESVESPQLPKAESGEHEKGTWFRQAIPGDSDWPGMSYAVASAKFLKQKSVAIITSFRSPDPAADAIGLATTRILAKRERLIGYHEREWDQFWSQSGIEMEDKELRKNWYRSLYFLRCVSKPGVLSPGLFAGLVNNTPAWHGDYHLNYNLQQTYWGAYAANHLELTEPYDRLILQRLSRAQWLARNIFSMKGAFFPHVLFAHEPPDPAQCKNPNGRQYFHHVWGMSLGVSALTVQPLWWHYKYSSDKQYLEATAYPPLREAANFYADFVAQCEPAGSDSKTIVLGPSVSPEHWGWAPGLQRNYNSTFDLAMIRFSLQAAAEAAEILGRDSEEAAHWKHASELLPSFPTSGKEFAVVTDIAGAEPIEYNIPVPITPVFPAGIVNWRSSEEERDLFTRSLLGLKTNGNNSMVMMGVAGARLGLTGAADWLRGEISARQRPNGTLSLNHRVPHHPFNDYGAYCENFGIAAPISEMMLQSIGGVIRVFPAMPKESSAAFENLRAQGGFLVSASLRQGKLERFQIKSTAGGTLRWMLPGNSDIHSKETAPKQEIDALAIP